MSRYRPRRLGVRSRCWVAASMERHGPRQTTVTVVGTIHSSTSVGLPRAVPEKERDTPVNAHRQGAAAEPMMEGTAD